MKNTFLKAGLASTFLAASAVAGSAALLDFTDDTAYDVQGTSSATGTLANGITWELLPTPATWELTYVADGPSAGQTPPLAGDNDGVGVQEPGTTNDEVTGPVEMLTLTFSEKVILSGLFFLDLFTDGGSEAEFSIVNVDGGSDKTFEAYETYVFGGFGFGEFTTKLVGTSFVFSVGNTNDAVASPDYALAGVDVAPIPLPAGLLLMGTALAGLGVARRNKKA